MMVQEIAHLNSFVAKRKITLPYYIALAQMLESLP